MSQMHRAQRQSSRQRQLQRLHEQRQRAEGETAPAHARGRHLHRLPSRELLINMHRAALSSERRALATAARILSRIESPREAARPPDQTHRQPLEQPPLGHNPAADVSQFSSHRPPEAASEGWMQSSVRRALVGTLATPTDPNLPERQPRQQLIDAAAETQAHTPLSGPPDLQPTDHLWARRLDHLRTQIRNLEQRHAQMQRELLRSPPRPPLPGVRPRAGLFLENNPESTGPCISCEDPNGRPVWCGHQYCVECLNSMINASLEGNGINFPPHCCGVPFMQERELEGVLQPEVLAAYKEKREEMDAPHKVYCATVDCGKWIKPAGISGNIGTCSKCGGATCVLCRNLGPHEGGTCPVDKGQQELSGLAKERNWARCSQCQSFVELTEGCNHMRCRCGSEFCYKCGAVWRTCRCSDFNREAARRLAAGMFRTVRRRRRLQDQEYFDYEVIEDNSGTLQTESETNPEGFGIPRPLRQSDSLPQLASAQTQPLTIGGEPENMTNRTQRDRGDTNSFVDDMDFSHFLPMYGRNS